MDFHLTATVSDPAAQSPGDRKPIDEGSKSNALHHPAEA
jgi:hypothetical protein